MPDAKVYILAASFATTGEAVEVKAQIVTGEVKSGMFLRIPLNGSLDVTAPIGAVVESVSNEVLLVLNGGKDWAEILIALDFVDEELRVTVDGEL